MYQATKVGQEMKYLATDAATWQNECQQVQIQRDQLLQKIKDIREETLNLENQNWAELERRLVLIEAMARAAIARVEGDR